MAGEGTEFTIDLGVSGASAAAAAANSVGVLSAALEAAEKASSAASEALKAGEAAYKAAESGASRAALAVERIGLAADAQRGKLAKALEVGDVGGADRAAAKLANLTQRQVEATAKATSTAAAMNAAAVALDHLKASATGAATSQANVSKALEQSKAKAASATKALQAAAKPVNAGEAAGALGKLGGPLGSIGQKAFDAADAFKKMGSSLGSAGPYVAAAVAIVAIATAVATVSVAVLAGIGAITMWAVQLADTDGVLKKLSDRASTSFKKIFSGLNIKPLLGELTKAVSVLDEGTASANAIKAVFESLFQPVVDGVTAFVPKMVSAFIQFEILVMKAMIAIKPFGSKIQAVAEVFGLLALAVAAMAVGFTIAVITPFAIIIGLAAALVAGVYAVVTSFISAAKSASGLGESIMSSVGAAFDWLKGLSLAELGTALIDGLIAGIVAGGAGVLSAITGIAGGAINAAKSALGIASPSKVFAEIGGHTAEGMEQGIDGGAQDVQSSMVSMVAPPDAATLAAPAATVSGGGSGATYIIQLSAKGDSPKDYVDAFVEWFESVGAQAGTAVPNA
ncbi:MAG TPA: hypothetical protein VNJ04_05160 [Gemmatimonadaceae bacterium]|nr:hypothetical protein [Gemmatimonadaceae bacterium]